MLNCKHRRVYQRSYGGNAISGDWNVRLRTFSSIPYVQEGFKTVLFLNEGLDLWSSCLDSPSWQMILVEEVGVKLLF